MVPCFQTTLYDFAHATNRSSLCALEGADKLVFWVQGNHKMIRTPDDKIGSLTFLDGISESLDELACLAIGVHKEQDLRSKIR